MLLNQKIILSNPARFLLRGALSVCFAALLFAVFSIDGYAQRGGSFTPREVRFVKGKSSAALKGTVKGAKGFVYELRARENQTLIVRLTGRAVFTVNDPNGEQITEENETRSSMILGATGKYLIFVSGDSGDSASRPFTLQITIK